MKHTYICPDCHSKLIFKDNIHRVRNSLRRKYKKSGGPYPDITLKEEMYNVFCEKCGAHMFQVDNDIADIIITLNSAGLKTKFSCSGHLKKIDNLVTNETTTEYPYILFDPSANELLRQISHHFYYKSMEEYDLVSFKESHPIDFVGQDPSTVPPCFRIGFKFEFKEIKYVDGSIDRIMIHGKECISECLKQMRKFSEDLIKEVKKIKSKGEN